MEIKGMVAVAIAEAMPTDNKLYLFIDSLGITSAMYATIQDAPFLIAIGLDYWIKPSDFVESVGVDINGLA